MVKRKIVWSHRASIQLFKILEFYTERNKSSVYSKKLYKKLIKKVRLLIKQPEIGIKTDIEHVRGLIVDDYILFYEITTDFITVHAVWDCRQNPDNLYFDCLSLQKISNSNAQYYWILISFAIANLIRTSIIIK